MGKLLEIRLPKMILFLTPEEIVKNLPESVLIKALQRGKAYRRGQRVEGFEERRVEYGYKNARL